MNESQEKFLRLAAERLPVDRVVEIHLFAPIRQGAYETGIAVVAARRLASEAGDMANAAPSLPDEAPAQGAARLAPDEGGIAASAGVADASEAEPEVVDGDVRGDPTEAAAGAPPVGSVDNARDGAEPRATMDASDAGDAGDDTAGGPPPAEMSLVEGEGASPDDRAANRDDASSAGAPGGPPPIPTSLADTSDAQPNEGASDRIDATASAPDDDDLDPELAALGVGEAEALAADFAESAALFVLDPTVRHTVFTARYRLAVKGPERGRFEVDVQEEADAPMLTIDLVVRGVQRRHDDSAEPERLPGERLREIVATVPLPPQAKSTPKPGAKGPAKAPAKPVAPKR